jgi:hypothetical protein
VAIILFSLSISLALFIGNFLYFQYDGFYTQDANYFYKVVTGEETYNSRTIMFLRPLAELSFFKFAFGANFIFYLFFPAFFFITFKRLDLAFLSVLIPFISSIMFAFAQLLAISFFIMGAYLFLTKKHPSAALACLLLSAVSHGYAIYLILIFILAYKINLRIPLKIPIIAFAIITPWLAWLSVKFGSITVLEIFSPTYISLFSYCTITIPLIVLCLSDIIKKFEEFFFLCIILSSITLWFVYSDAFSAVWRTIIMLDILALFFIGYRKIELKGKLMFSLFLAACIANLFLTLLFYLLVL